MGNARSDSEVRWMDEVLVCLSTATEADHFIMWEDLAWILCRFFFSVLA